MSETAPREIVVVGGGIIGVCTAYYLLSSITPASSPVTRVTLVEEEVIAGAASGKAGGFLALDWHGPATTSLAKLSYRLHRDLATEYGGAERWGYRAMESVSFAVTAGAGGGKSPHPNPALEDSKMETIEATTIEASDSTWLNPDGDTSVLGTKDTTAQIHPRLFTEALFAAALEKGLRYICARPTKLNLSSSNSLPESIDVLSSSVNSAFSTAQTIPCTDLILAAGPWTALLASSLGISPTPPIHNLPGHSIVVRPATSQLISATAVFASIYGANPRHAAAAAAAAMTDSPEIFPRSDGTVYIAGENNAAEMPERPGEVLALVDGEIAQRLVRAAKVIGRVLGEGTVEATQLCYRPTTPDRRPVVGKVKERIWIAAGHGPWGITLAPGTGMVMSELVLEGAAKSADISGLDPRRFGS